MKGIVLFLCITALLIGASDAFKLRKRSGAGDEPQAPVLEHLELPDIDTTSTSNVTTTFVVSDPAGVKYVHVWFGNDTYLVGEASWNATSTQQSVTGTVRINVYQVVTGMFPLSVTVCDVLNNCDTYDSEDLDAAGFQSTAIIFTNQVSISCPPTPLSVLDGGVEFDCTLTVHSDPLPVVAYSVYAVLSTGNKVVISTVYPDNGSYDNPDATDQDISIALTFRLIQYAPNGTYTVFAEACGPNYMYDTTTSTFTVKAEINDLSAPTLKSVSAPSVTLPASLDSINIMLTITDDAVGVKSAVVNVPGFGTGSWSNSDATIGTSTSVSITVPIIPDADQLVRRLYYVTLTVCDKTDKCKDWSTDELYAAGMQSTLNIGPVDPNGDQATVSCGGPYDVANGPVEVTCTYSVTFVTGIYTYTVFASRNVEPDSDEPQLKMQAVPGFYKDDTGSQITLTSTQKFVLPQYAPYGNYTVLATAYDDALVRSIVGTHVFVVSHTTNDMGPPTLRTLSVPVPATISSFKARVSANDDASGIALIQVYLFSKGTTGVGIANLTQSNNNRVVTNVEIPIVVNVYNSTDSVFFVVEVMLVDVQGNKKYYSTVDLGNQGFQANVTLTSRLTTTGSATTSTDAGVSLSASVPTTIMLAFVSLLFIHFLFV